MKRIAVLASGGGTNFQAIIDGTKNGKIAGEVVLLIYNRKNAYAKVRAKSNAIEAVYINRIKSKGIEKMKDDVFDALNKANIDIIVLAGYLEKLGVSTVETWKNKIINTHPALIPMFCGEGFYGQKVHQAVIDNGVKVSGCTIHLVDANYDSGPILMQKGVNVMRDDTATTLAERILPYEHKALVECVDLLCRNAIRVEGKRTFIDS